MKNAKVKTMAWICATLMLGALLPACGTSGDSDGGAQPANAQQPDNAPNDDQQDDNADDRGDDEADDRDDADDRGGDDADDRRRR